MIGEILLIIFVSISVGMSGVMSIGAIMWLYNFCVRLWKYYRKGAFALIFCISVVLLGIIGLILYQLGI